MKIGVSSYSFSKYIIGEKADYIDVCNKAKEMGFDGIEFVDLDWKSWGLTSDPLATAKQIKEHCKSIGLEIVAYTVGGNMLADDIAAEVERLKGCVRVCAELGAPVMRHDVCYSMKKEHLYNWQSAIEDMVGPIREVCDYAESLGIRTCVENHGRIFQAPERVEALIKAVDRKNYGWLVDIGNFLCADCRPDVACGIGAPYAFHVHAKDFIYKSGSEPRPTGFFGTAGGNHLRGTVVGHGIVPVRNCVEILKEVGYDGWISVEFEGMEDCLAAIKAGFEHLKSLV